MTMTGCSCCDRGPHPANFWGPAAEDSDLLEPLQKPPQQQRQQQQQQQLAAGRQYAQLLRNKGWTPVELKQKKDDSPPCFLLPMHSQHAGMPSALVPDMMVHVTAVLPWHYDNAGVLYLCDCADMTDTVNNLLSAPDLGSIPADSLYASRCVHSIALEHGQLLTEAQKLRLVQSPRKSLQGLSTAPCGSVECIQAPWLTPCDRRRFISAVVDEKPDIMSRSIFVGQPNGLIACSTCSK